MNNQDTNYMNHAIFLAKEKLWQTAPNPTVGSVIVKNDIIVGKGYHNGSGTNHAEVEAILDAKKNGVDLSSCTLYVTLEPCNHTGKMPPCSKAILDSGIKRVVIGTKDPTSSGGGAKFLSDNGIDVVVGLCEDSCKELIEDFIFLGSSSLPYTILKLASTLDGRIATRTGESKWITSFSTRQHGHRLRKKVQAVVIGGNTLYHDDPYLTCRIEEDSSDIIQPLAVVVSSRLPDSTAPFYLLQNRPTDTIFWTTVAAAASPKAEALRKIGVRVFGFPPLTHSSRRSYGMRAELSLFSAFKQLREEFGCNYVLCEGGGNLGFSLLNSGIARELFLHLSPKILADNEATPLFNGKSPLSMAEALELKFMETIASDPDVILRLRSTLPVQTDDLLES